MLIGKEFLRVLLYRNITVIQYIKYNVFVTTIVPTKSTKQYNDRGIWILLHSYLRGNMQAIASIDSIELLKNTFVDKTEFLTSYEFHLLLRWKIKFLHM